MNADEIVRALRKCKAYKTKSVLQTTMLMAADCVEALQAELAERDEELKRLQKEVASLAIESVKRDVELARLEAEVMAAIDAVPVVRGEWEDIPNRYVCVAGDRPYHGNATSCSVCHDINPNAFKTNFCPNCGAKMDGERRESEVTP